MGKNRVKKGKKGYFLGKNEVKTPGKLPENSRKNPKKWPKKVRKSRQKIGKK